jgi:hypothetical protein
MQTLRTVALTMTMCLIWAGCATMAPDPGLVVKEASSPSWALRSSQSEITIAVSPARQTLQILGSSGAIIGAGISAMANDRYRQELEPVLKDYEPGKVFEERLATRLQEAAGKLTRVAPPGSTAGVNSARDAEKARFETLAKKGHDRLLDLKMTYGIFGYDGLLIAELEGKLVELPSGHAVWRNDVIASAMPILASDKLTDPTALLKPNFSSPRLSAREDAISQWTRDGGASFRASYEAAVDGAVSAILTDLGLTKEAAGYYYLGRQALFSKDFENAETYFKNALALDPGNVDAKNGLAVAKAHAKKTDDAIALANEIVQAEAEYAPAHYNLAWWYALDKNDAAAARPHYAKALELGLAGHKKLDKSLSGK